MDSSSTGEADAKPPASTATAATADPNTSTSTSHAAIDEDNDDGVPDFQPTTEVVGGRYMFIRNVFLRRHPERNNFGLQLKSPGEKERTNSIGCLVKAVLPSCSAPEGSILPEDQLLSINGKTILDWSYHEIVSFIKEQNPDTLVLSFRRELPKPSKATKMKAGKKSDTFKGIASTTAKSGNGDTSEKVAPADGSAGGAAQNNITDTSKVVGADSKKRPLEDIESSKAAPSAAPTASTANPGDTITTDNTKGDIAGDVGRNKKGDVEMADVQTDKSAPGAAPPSTSGGATKEAAAIPGQNAATSSPAPIAPSTSSTGASSSASASAAATVNADTTTSTNMPADASTKVDANASTILPPFVAGTNSVTPAGTNNALASFVAAAGTTAAGQPDQTLKSPRKENDGSVEATKVNNVVTNNIPGEEKPKKKRGRPRKKKPEENSASNGDGQPTKDDQNANKKRKKSKKGDGSTAGSVDSTTAANFDLTGVVSSGNSTPDLTFTSEKGEGETDVDRLIKATIGAQASNISEPDKPDADAPPQIRFVFISAPIREGRVAAEIVLNDVKIGSIFAEFVCKSKNFVEKCELIGREFLDLEIATGDLFREGGQIQCEELRDFHDDWEPKNRPMEEAYYLQIKHIYIQETEFDSEEEQSNIIMQVLHLFLNDPKVKRWKIAGYKTVHGVGEFFVSDEVISSYPGSPEEVVEQKWVERETLKNKQIGADARPFVRVGFRELDSKSSQHKGILFLTKKMFLPEQEVLSHSQALETKLRCDAPVDVEEYRKDKLNAELVSLILNEDIDEELDSRRFNSQTSLHRAPETYDADGELVKKLMPQIEEFIAKGADLKESHILHAAAHRHYLGLLKPLIDKGADVNAFDNNSMTPLMIVAANVGKRIEVDADRSLRIIWDLRSLCSADRNLRDRAGRTALGHYYRAWRDVRGIDREVGAPIRDTPINKGIEEMLCPDGGPTEADMMTKAGC